MNHLLILLFSLVRYGRAQQTFFPAAIPLAVRSPYLSGWDFTTNGTTIGRLWSTTSTNGSDTLSLPVHLRVDNITYSFLGNSQRVNGSVNLTNTVISPTQTKFTAEAGPMQFNLTFLNPIEPGDWVRQSIPFSYLSLTAESLDGAAHAVQVYSDVSGEWLSGDRSQEIEWSTTSDKNLIYHKVELQNPATFNEINSQADWGTLYYAMGNVGNITFKTGLADNCRGLFQLNGTLDNQKNSTFGPIGPNPPVFAISRDLGTIQTTQDSVVWTIGLTTDPAIQYQRPSADAPQQRSLYYKTQYTTDMTLILDFLNDFDDASIRAQELDSLILGDATAVSGSLGDLVSLATAQVYGSIQLTVRSDASYSSPMAFMKNIGGPGSSTNRVNAVETLYAAFPAFMYIDPTLGGLLLEPLFHLQASPSYQVPYAAADLGSNYPNVSISNSSHGQGIEQSANMLIMTYAYARASGDGSLIYRYYSLLTSWADYLSNFTLYTTNETSADGLTTNNQTNLAIKGIIAIEAMSKMSTVAEEKADADKYSNTALSLYSQWENLALASDQHLLAAYGLVDSWTLGYNLFADVWLGTNVVESSVCVYYGQSNFIDTVTLTSNFSNYGMPVDYYNTSIAASSWTLFAAAMTSDLNQRTNLISRVHNRASYNTSAGVFPVLYNSTSGLIDLGGVWGGASPAQGAMYAPLALSVPVQQISFAPTASGHTGTIAGLSAGGAALLAIGIITLVVRRRRRRSRRAKSIRSSSDADVIDPDWPMGVVTPFDPTLDEVAEPETGSQENLLQQRWTQPVDPETVPLVHASTSPLPSPPVVPVPVGLTSKELARLRRDNLLSQSTGAQPSDPQLPATTELGVATSSSEARRLQSEVETLRREVELLTERIEAPPRYDSEDGNA